MSNVVLKKDSAENFMPDKEKSIERIDGVASLNDCMALYILNQQTQETQTPSIRSF